MKDAWNDAAAAQEYHLPRPSPVSVPRERLDPLRERPVAKLLGQSAPEVYWTGPRGVRPDVMEPSVGSGTFFGYMQPARTLNWLLCVTETRALTVFVLCRNLELLNQEQATIPAH